MTGPASIRDSPTPVAPQRSRPAPLDNAPDPWGVRRAENLLTSLEGVLSARVVTTPLGEVSEVHILAQAGLAPKQLVRNIESALLAQLGLKVDHRKISIAQTADVRPIEALEQGAVRDRALQRAVLFEELSVAPGKRPHRIGITVTLSLRGAAPRPAEEESTDTPRSRVEAAARAAVHGAGPAALGSFGGAGGGQDRGGLRPGVRVRGGAGAGRAGDAPADRHRGDQGERGAGGGVRGAGRDQPVGGGAAAAVGWSWVMGRGSWVAKGKVRGYWSMADADAEADS